MSDLDEKQDRKQSVRNVEYSQNSVKIEKDYDKSKLMKEVEANRKEEEGD